MITKEIIYNFLNELKNRKIYFKLVGSSLLLLNNYNIQPNDIDIVCNKENEDEIISIFKQIIDFDDEPDLFFEENVEGFIIGDINKYAENLEKQFKVCSTSMNPSFNPQLQKFFRTVKQDERIKELFKPETFKYYK